VWEKAESPSPACKKTRMNGIWILSFSYKEGHNCLFIFYENVKRQLCPSIINKWKEMESILFRTRGIGAFKRAIKYLSSF
jgi:hypothetical protein